MHEAALAGAALPAPSVVLGLLMRPYSLGHELFLLREGNPFLNWTARSTRVPGPDKLLEACLICSNSWAENQRMPFDRLLRFKLWIIGWRNRKASWPLEMLKFSAYRQAGSLELPPYDVLDPEREPARTPGSPFLLRLNAWIMAHLGLSEEEAWDYPYGLAKMRWESFWEQEGGFKVTNEDEGEFDAWVEEQERERKAKECQA
jgi:hypothetical protein